MGSAPLALAAWHVSPGSEERPSEPTRAKSLQGLRWIHVEPAALRHGRHLHSCAKLPGPLCASTSEGEHRPSCVPQPVSEAQHCESAPWRT